MADPAQVMAAVPDDLRAALIKRSNRKGLLHLVAHASVITILMVYIASGLPLWWAAMLPLGLALVFLFTLQHECTHQTPFETPLLNEAVGHLCALILLQPFLWFRAFHLAHHKHTNDVDHDPELQGSPKPQTRRAFVWHLSTLGYWADKLGRLVANARGAIDAPYISPRARPRLMREARWLIVVYCIALVFTIFISPILIWIWALPLILGFPFLRLYLLAEHSRCPMVANMFENSRTTLTNRMMNALAWNMPYHAEHHAYPNVPFHKLPDAHALAAPHLEHTSDGYAAFSSTYFRSLG